MGFCRRVSVTGLWGFRDSMDCFQGPQDTGEMGPHLLSFCPCGIGCVSFDQPCSP